MEVRMRSSAPVAGRLFTTLMGVLLTTFAVGVVPAQEPEARRVNVEIKYVSLPPGATTDLDLEWDIVGAPKTTKSEQPISAERAESGKGSVRLSSFVETKLPVLVSTIEPAAIKKLIDSAKGDSRTNMVGLPTVSLVSGIEKTVKEVSLLPLYVNSDVVDHQSGGPKADRDPVQVIEQGIVLKLKPVVSGDGVFLDGEMTLSEVVSVKTIETVLSVGQDPIKIPVPVVSTLEFRFAVNAALGRTTIVKSFQDGLNGDQVEILILITCTQPGS